MERKVLVLSGLSILAGICIGALSAFSPAVKELVNYGGGMLILLGAVFYDSAVVSHIYGEGKPPKRSLIRLAVYLLLAVCFIMVPQSVAMMEAGRRLCRALGIAFLLLALLKFFVFTTMGEQEITD